MIIIFFFIQLPMQYNRNIDLTNILKEVARKSIISEVPLINRAITYTQKNDLILKTDGINIVVCSYFILKQI